MGRMRIRVSRTFIVLISVAAAAILLSVPFVVLAASDDKDIVTFAIDRKLNGDDTGEIITWSPAGDIVVATLLKGPGTTTKYSFRVWNTRTWTEETKVTDHSSAIRAMEFNKDGSLLATASIEIILFETKTWTVVQLLDFENRTKIGSLAWSPDGSHIAAGLDDGGLHVLDLTTSTIDLDAQVATQGPLGPVRWSPNGDMLAIGYIDGYVGLWPFPDTGPKIHEFKVHGDNMVSDIVFTPNGKEMYSVGYDSRIAHYDLTTWKGTALGSHREGRPILDLSMSVSGKKAISAGDKQMVIWDTSVPLWDLLQIIGDVRGTAIDKVHMTAWSPDGESFVSAQMGAIFLWQKGIEKTEKPLLEEHEMFALVMAIIALVSFSFLFAAKTKGWDKPPKRLKVKDGGKGGYAEDEEEEDEEEDEGRGGKRRRREKIKSISKKHWSKE